MITKHWYCRPEAFNECANGSSIIGSMLKYYTNTVHLNMYIHVHVTVSKSTKNAE